MLRRAVVPDVTVTVLDIEKGIARESSRQMPPASTTHWDFVTRTYKITFAKTGFSQYVRLPHAECRNDRDQRRKIGGLSQEVVVNTDVPLLKTETGEQSTTLVAKEMQNLPHQGQDWRNFVKLIPGATGTTTYSTATAASAIGQRNLPYNAILNDGAPPLRCRTGNADVSVFETVQEVQISTSAFSAQYGTAARPSTQISKEARTSGTGRCDKYAQNDFFNARSYFQTTAPYTRFHNFGGSVSGRSSMTRRSSTSTTIRSLISGASVGFNTVPTLAMRSGRLSPLWHDLRPDDGLHPLLERTVKLTSSAHSSQATRSVI